MSTEVKDAGRVAAHRWLGNLPREQFNYLLLLLDERREATVAEIVAWLRSYNHHEACDVWPDGIGYCTCAYDRDEARHKRDIADALENGSWRG